MRGLARPLSFREKKDTIMDRKVTDLYIVKEKTIMHFVACKIDEARGNRSKNSDIRKLLMKIIDSGEECVEIKDYTHKNTNSCYTALRARIVKDRLKQLEVVTRGDRVFVINTLIVKEVK